VGDVVLAQDFHDRLDHVGAVLIQGVVARVHVIGMGTVIVHGKTTAQVEITHGGPFEHKAGVNPAGFLDGGPDVPDIRDLRTEVIVEELETVQHAHFFELLDGLYDLGDGQAEDAPVAAGFGPVAACLGCELQADTQQGLDPSALTVRGSGPALQASPARRST
jgi:hypothetical protein